MSRLLSIATICALAACHPNKDNRFDRTELASDQPAVAAVVDPGLVNAWGIAVDSSDRVFIAANGTGQISAFDNILRTPVGFPAVTPDAAPLTGLAINTTSGFVISGDRGVAPADLISASEDGKVYAFSALATSAPMLVLDLSATGAVFKGVAIVETAGVPTLLLTDFGNNTIVQLDTDLRVVTPAAAAAAFFDPAVPADFGPFGIEQLGSLVYVTFVAHGEGLDEAHGPGLGIVDSFTSDGVLVTEISNSLALNAPWGLAIAPAKFGDFDDALIVSNFGDGVIHAFDPVNGDFLGTFDDSAGDAIVIPGVWGLAFGTAGDSTTLFFSAGPDEETHGLFGKLVPEGS